MTLLSCEIKQNSEEFTLTEINSLKSYDNLDSLPINFNQVYRLNLSKKNLLKLPQIVFKLPNLQELDVSENKLSDLNGIDKLEKLQILNIGMNNFRIFPNEITKLKKLKVLDIYWNDIKTFPETFYKNNLNIEELDMTNLFNFDFVSNLTKIHQFKNLIRLNLGNNQIPKLTIQFNKLNNLTEFGYIRQEKINTVNILTDLSSCKRLKILHLSGNHIKTLPKEIALLNSLEILNLYQNELKELPDETLNMKNLKELTLIDNPVETLKIKKFEVKMPKTKFIY